MIMDPKDFKFNDDAFDGVFPEQEDSFEDIYSGRQSESHRRSFESEFDDIFSGRQDWLEDRPYEDNYYEENDKDGQFESVHTSSNNIPENSEQKPYSYNYNKAAQNRAKKVSRERFSDSIEGDEVSSGRQPRTKKEKSFSTGRAVKTVIAFLLVFSLIAGVGSFFYAKGLTRKVNNVPLTENKYISASELMRKDGVKNIILIGVDGGSQREGEATRSDTMMLLTIDENNRQLKLSSFLRDTYIEIPGHSQNKLNAAQQYGGAQLLVDTLEYNFKTDIDNYMLVNFDMFITIIDSLGGVNLEVTEAEAKYINSKDHMTEVEAAAFPEDIESGSSVHLTGAQALWYARIRYLDSDFMRTQRQRKVISAIVKKATRTNPVTLMTMLNKIVPMVETDLDSNEMMKLGMSALKYLRYDIAQQQIPAPNTWQNGTRKAGSVLVIDLEENRKILKQFVFEKVEIKDDKKS
ncbi:MAG: LytR family transcriptional regulator [Ruminococcaceae bacterium]|nr:LytR family transcriptional regulator [Oscillospiraceae bacterium]